MRIVQKFRFSEIFMNTLVGHRKFYYSWFFQWKVTFIMVMNSFFTSIEESIWSENHFVLIAVKKSNKIVLTLAHTGHNYHKLCIPVKYTTIKNRWMKHWVQIRYCSCNWARPDWNTVAIPSEQLNKRGIFFLMPTNILFFRHDHSWNFHLRLRFRTFHCVILRIYKILQLFF